jgi:ribosome-binding factor A
VTNPRMRKVNSTMREVLADEVERLTDPRLELLSVTAVDTSPDLRSAVVYVSTLELEHGPEAVAALTGAASRLQQAVARQVRLKYTPQLRFVLDEAIVQGERIEALLRDLSHEGEGDEEE